MQAEQVKAQQAGAEAQRAAAEAQKSAAEAQAAETRRLGEAAELKRKQREEGTENLRQMESNLPWYRRALRDYGTPLGVVGGLVAGPAARAGVTKFSNKLAQATARDAESLFEETVKGTPGRVARVNEFWRRGKAGEVPFTSTPDTAPGFAANPKAPPVGELYGPSKTKDFLTDLGVTGAFGTEAGASAWMGSQAHEELTRATEAANTDPSEINIRALEAAKDKVAAFDALMNFGRTGAVSYPGAAVKMKRVNTRPSMTAAEEEKLKLEDLLRKRLQKAKAQGSTAQN
jgi:hypothetical protein